MGRNLGGGSGGGRHPGGGWQTESREVMTEGGAKEETGGARVDQTDRGARETTGGTWSMWRQVRPRPQS